MLINTIIIILGLGVLGYSLATLFHSLFGFTDGDTLDDTALLSKIGVLVIDTYNKYYNTGNPLGFIAKAVLCKLCFSGHCAFVLAGLACFLFGLPLYIPFLAGAVGFTIANTIN